MPPKPKYTKQEIIEAAYQMTRESGIDSVVARAVGKKLGTSSSPIFTVFNSMDEVKQEIRNLAKTRFREYMADVYEYDMAFKEFGMRWVNFAHEEPNLYRFLFLGGGVDSNPYRAVSNDFSETFEELSKEVMKEFDVSEESAKTIMNQMLIVANGIACFWFNDSGLYDEELVNQALSRACISLVISSKMLEGTYNPKVGEAMLEFIRDARKPDKK